VFSAVPLRKCPALANETDIRNLRHSNLDGPIGAGAIVWSGQVALDAGCDSLTPVFVLASRMRKNLFGEYSRQFDAVPLARV
jgi:hypothetical protein